MDNVYQSKSKDSGRDCEHHFQLSFALPFFSTLPFLKEKHSNVIAFIVESKHFVAPDFDWQRQL